MGDGQGRRRVPNSEYVWVRLGNATSNTLVMAYLDRRDTQDDALLPAEGDTVFLLEEPRLWRVLVDTIHG
jgi:hypothetical protein